MFLLYSCLFIVHTPSVFVASWGQRAVAARVQEGLEDLSHVEGQEGWRRGDMPRPRYGAMAVLCWSSHEEIPHAQGKRNPSKTVGVARGHQRANTLKPYLQKTSQSNHTRTIALSNSMKLSHARGATQDGRVMVERSDRMWSTGEGNGKPLQYSCFRTPWTVWKGKMIGYWKRNSPGQ